MDLELQITQERKNSISDLSHSDSLPSIDSLGPDSLTGWTNQKATIPGLCSEKPIPSFCIQNSTSKANGKPPKRPSTISTLPCSDEPSPRRSHLRLKSRLKKFRGQSVGKEEEQAKNWKTSDVFNNLRNKFRSLKTKSSSFSKEHGKELDGEARVAWLQAHADQTYGNPYVAKTDKSKLLLHPGEGWAAMRTNSYASKGIDDLDISQISGKYIQEGRIPANITLYPLSGPNGSKRKQRNYSLNNANLSTLRKTFMGISMIAAQANNTPVFKEPAPTLDSSLLLTRKPRGSVQHRELYTEEPLGHLGIRSSIENKPLISDMLEVKKPAFHARKLSAQRAKIIPLSEEKPNASGAIIKVENEQLSFDVKEKKESKPPKIMPKKDDKKLGLRGTRGVPKSNKSPKPKVGVIDVVPKAFEVIGGKLGNLKSFY